MKDRPRKHDSTKPDLDGLRVFALSWLVLALVFGNGLPVLAYLKFSVPVGSRQVIVKWARSPVRYFVSDRTGATGIGPSEFQAVIGGAFSTWQALPTASIAFQFAGFTAARPFEDDGQAVLGFQERPELNRVLASTSLLIDNTTGEILESDIFFNTAFQWSVASGGEAGKFDLESVALHEIGHLAGLGHSALGETEPRPEGGRRVIAAEAVMFPIAYPAGNVLGRSLRADDIAGISDLYPDGDYAAATGSVSGSVIKGGRGLFGAHVVAFNPATGSLVGGFSLNDQGRFSIAGLAPGPYVLRVEPLDDGDIDSFFSARATVDLDFRAGFVDRLAIAPRGGDSGEVEIAVVPK